MISTTTFQSILDDVLQESGEDLVGLWLVQTWVQRAGSGLDAASVWSITLALVDQAVTSGKVVVGSFVGDEFHIWNIGRRDARERIECMWSDATRALTPTDNVWLVGRDLNYRAMK
jgi:hypothetical protein